MSLATVRIAGFLTVFAPLVSGASDQAQILPDNQPAIAVAPENNVFLNRCIGVAEREEIEADDCLQAARYELLEGRITLAEALRRLEDCALLRPDLASLGEAARTRRIQEYAAYLAFGLAPDSLHLHAEAWGDPALQQTIDGAEKSIPEGSVRQLRSIGVTPAGLTNDGSAERLEEAGVQEAFARTLGPRNSARLLAMLRGEQTAAIILGGSVILPGPQDGAADGPSLISIPLESYQLEVSLALRELESTRLAYLAAAARSNQEMSSVRSFLRLVRSLGKVRGSGDPGSVERHRERLDRSLHLFRTHFHPDPLLDQAVGESFGLASTIVDRCDAAAVGRGRWIRTGAGMVAGLVLAAGAVVASGATGTLIGGITIAAALEASVGAYLLARSESFAEPVVATGRLSSVVPEVTEETEFERPDLSFIADEGELGAGEGEYEEWFGDEGGSREKSGLAGEGIDENSDESTEAELAGMPAPTLLPADLPDDLTELPPLLNAVRRPERSELTLPDIKHRLDEFLALDESARLAGRVDFAEEIAASSLAQMIDEATQALDLWERRRTLHDGFGPFFVSAETERLPERQRPDARNRALGRFLHDRETFEGSANLEELRERLASRLIVHCRNSDPRGDLLLSACTDETALSMVVIAAIRDAGIRLPAGETLGIQAFPQSFEAVLYSRSENVVRSLTRGSTTEGVVAPIYYPATFYYAYLVGNQVVPEIDFDKHLVAALPDRPMPPGMRDECVPRERSTVGRAVDFLGSLVGVRRLDTDGCSSPESGGANGSQGGNRSITIAMPMPRNPLQSGGGQGGGGQGGGGGGGGGSPLSGRAPRDASSGGAQGSQAGGGSAGGDEGTSTRSGSSGSASAADQGGASDGSAASGGSGGSETTDPGQPSGGKDAGGDGSGGSDDGSGSGGTGGYGVGSVDLPLGPNLTGIGRATVEMTREYERGPADRVLPWRLRDDEGMMTGSTSRVLFADNAKALERFEEDDLFITLTPAEVEAQRRMLEADAHPIFSAETTCDSRGLPPRRVFRRAAAGERPYRYVYCDQDESMVIFRERTDAESYAALSPPDRPLYLARLAAERLERFERSDEMAAIRSFLADPNSLRDKPRDDVYAMVGMTGDILVFQNALESALVQSMNELGPSEVRGFYYEMHRQVLQAPFFRRLAEDVFRLNRRLASDPLQSLAWANAQPVLARRGFFDLYFNLGRVMEWPTRWAKLEEQYGKDRPASSQSPTSAASLDFLQVLSDPMRVRVDWTSGQPNRASIVDQSPQEGAARSPEVRPRPTLSELLQKQEREKHQSGGTGGLGRAGDGLSIGPEKGDRPLQMIHIRIAPESGEPDRRQLPDDNQIRPGGTEGEKETQTEESATRQEPVLWVSAHTFAEAILSAWDHRGLRPESADRVPPLLRFNERLRETFLDDLKPEGVYDTRLIAAMEVFTSSDWLDYDEVRRALGGDWVDARAFDTGRFSAAYSGNPPINEEDQIRIPNFFASDGVTLPADLFPAVSQHYTRSILGIFELSSSESVPAARSLAAAPVPAGTSREKRLDLIEALKNIEQQSSATGTGGK